MMTTAITFQLTSNFRSDMGRFKRSVRRVIDNSEGNYMSEFVMPWGKYRGTELCNLPSSYVRWLAESSFDDDICERADEEIKYRDDHSMHFESND